LVSNNCEDFASSCFNGESKSDQVITNGILSVAGTAGGVIIGGVATPSATVMGSAAISLGVISAPVLWPYYVIGAGIGALSLFGIKELKDRLQMRKICKENWKYDKNEQENIYSLLESIQNDDENNLDLETYSENKMEEIWVIVGKYYSDQLDK